MKKLFTVLIMISLLFSACGTKETFNADNQLEEIIEEQSNTGQEEEISTSGDIEGDINSSDLKEDEVLTEKAEAEHKTEEDVLVPQEEILEQEKIVEEEEQEEVLEVFKTLVPEDIELNIRYDKYPTSYNYLLILGNYINIREEPSTEARVINNASLFEKLNLEAKVKGQFLEGYDSDGWYKVFWKDGDEIRYGYVFEALGEPREFQFSKMKESLEKLKKEVEENKTGYISNYKNRNGIAPLYNGGTKDKYGTVRYQSAPAYFEAREDSEFRYIEDGTLVFVLEEGKSLTKIRTLNFEGEYWVPNKFISYSNSIEELTKVIVVDRRNQNEGVFEYFNGKWNLISYVFATTGEKAQYKQETSLGYFMAIQTRPTFLYLDDITREISGYAPYAIRFNGGAYIHGVPVEFEIVDDKRVDPGMKEYLFTIGTVPRSHKCVRNYTSHAKFLYEWIEIGKSAIIVIE